MLKQSVETTWFRLVFATVCVLALTAAYRLRLRQMHARQKLLEQHQNEITALNDCLMKAQEEERTRIAGELHDGVLQQITSLTLMLGTVKAQIDSGATKDKLSRLQKQLIQVGTDIRQLSHQLHPAVLQDDGLPAALSGYCEEFTKVRGIPVSCETDDHLKDLSPGAALGLYRIAQEALGNVAKHSKATKVEVRLTQADGLVCLSVSDVPGGIRRGFQFGSGFVVAADDSSIPHSLDKHEKPVRRAGPNGFVPRWSSCKSGKLHRRCGQPLRPWSATGATQSALELRLGLQDRLGRNGLLSLGDPQGLVKARGRSAG